MPKPRIILDTNILISYALRPNATITRTVRAAIDTGTVLMSQETFDELRSVIGRFVTRRYLTESEASEFLAGLVEATIWVKILESVVACRDPKDDMFLELAINGQAEYLVTGDKDLLALHPFRHVPILTPTGFLATYTTQGNG